MNIFKLQVTSQSFKLLSPFLKLATCHLKLLAFKFFLKKRNCFVLFALKNDFYKTIRGNLIFF